MNLDYSPDRLPSSQTQTKKIPSNQNSPYHSNIENLHQSLPTESSTEKDILYEYRKVHLASKVDQSLNDLYASLKASQNQLFKNTEHGKYNNSLTFDGVYNPFEKQRNIMIGNGFNYRLKSYRNGNNNPGTGPVPKFENIRYSTPATRKTEPGDVIRTDYTSSTIGYTNKVQTYLEK